MSRFDPLSPLLRMVLLPAYAALRGDRSLAFARRAAVELGWSAEQIAEARWERTRRIVEIAQASSPFHARRFAEHGVSAADLRDPSDLKRLPVMTKVDLREHLDAIVSGDVPEADRHPVMTGGSTDTPTRFFRDRRCLERRRGWQWALRAWFGWRPGDKVAWVWGAPQDLPSSPSWHWNLRQRHLHRELFLPCSRLGPDVFERMVQSLREFGPSIVCAYPSALALLAESMLDAGVTDIRPRAVVLTAEMVLPAHREVIGTAFGCPVFSFYSAREGGMVATECAAHEALHVNALSLNVELERNGRDVAPGEVGRVLLTDLENRATPLIRYEIGDAASPVAGACSCGSALPRIDFAAGRETDVLVANDGSLVPGASVACRLVTRPGSIVERQLIQETVGDLRVRVVRGEGFRDDDERELAALLRSHLGEDLRLRFEYVDEIAREASGKMRFCISSVGPRWLGSDVD